MSVSPQQIFPVDAPTYPVEQAADGILVADREGRYVDVNPAGCAMLGMTREEVLSSTLADLVAPEEQHRIAAEVARHSGGRIIRNEWRLRRKDKSAFNAEIVGCLLPNGNLQCVVRDITERKRAEQRALVQRQILELTATGASLKDVLDRLLLLIESQEPGMIAGILLTDDGAHFRLGSGPSIPAAYKEALREAIQTIPVTPPYFATCAELTHCCKITRVPDVAKDRQHAQPWRDSMLASGLHALRSTPVCGSDGRVIGCLALYFVTVRDPNPADPELVEMATHLAAIAIEHHEAEAAMRRGQAWIAGQKEAFQAAVNGAPLETSLGILLRTAIDQAGGDRRCAFHIANAEGTELRRVAGMSEAYAGCIDEVRISPDSLACGRAVATGRAVIMPDVHDEPSWKPWLGLADEHGYRGCWSFPVETSTGRIVGSFAMYFKEPREATFRDRELAAALTHAASIIISRHQEKEERERISRELADSESRLAAELEATQQLQTISMALLREQNVESLYDKIVGAAAAILRSDAASMQMLHPNRGPTGELQLLATRGFTAEAATFWEWVRADSASTCGRALGTGQRVVVSDVRTCDFMAGTEDRATYLEAGILAVQSTPLISRSGRLLGMISTHWRAPHEPNERDLRLLDLLARQAADLIERIQSEEALKRRAEQLKLLIAELNHRVKNTLATVQSIARQSLRSAETTADGRQALEARLIALAKAHDVLAGTHWEGADIHELVVRATSPYSGDGVGARFDIGGPQVRLVPRAALALSMALHELATNAVKYGALSTDTGRIRLGWQVMEAEPYGFRLEWCETGGPPVTRPSRRGFGSRLIERGLAQDLAGEVSLQFESPGVVCTVRAALEEIRVGDRTRAT